MDVNMHKVDEAYTKIYEIVLELELNPFEMIFLLEILRIANDGILQEMKSDIIEQMMGGK